MNVAVSKFRRGLGVAFGLTLWAVLLGAAGSPSDLDLDVTVAPDRGRVEVRAGGALLTVHESGDSTSTVLIDEHIVIAESHGNWFSRPGEGSAAGAEPAYVSGRVTYRLPSDWSMVASGRRIKRVLTAEGAVEEWIMEVPSRLAFAAGPFTRVSRVRDGRVYTVYLLTLEEGDIGLVLSRTTEGLGALESRLGAYPDTACTMVEVPNDLPDWHALAEPGFFMARTGAFTLAGGNLPLFAHELSHAWWGVGVRPAGPGGLFCSESLAQYFAAVAVEDLHGPRAATEFLRFSSAGFTAYESARGYFALAVQDLDWPLSKLAEAPNPRPLAYSKGPWVLRMLRRRTGDELFFGTLRGLFDEHEGGSLSLKEFRNRFIEVAPAEAGLESFFSQWLDRPGAPVLEMDWEDASDSERNAVELTVRQIQTGAPYGLRLDVGILSEGGTTVHELLLRDSSATVILACEGAPSQVVLDPRHQLLIWRPEYGVRPQLPD